MHRLKITFLATLLAASWVLPQAVPAGSAAVHPGKGDLTHTRVMSEFSRLAAQPAEPASTSLTAAQPLSIVAAANQRLRREVFGFVDAGNLGSYSVGYPSWNMSLLSTVAFFALQVNSGDGNFVTTNTGWSVYHSSTMTNFVNAAHANGVRVIVSINLHDFSTSPTNQVCQGLVAANAQNTINQSVQQMAAAGIDGINIDYEATNTTCANGLTSRAQMTTFTQNMRAAMPKGSYLAIDTYTGSAEDNLEFFDVTGLAPSVDAFFVMAYDMDYSNATELPLSCTSYCFNPTSPLNTYRFNVTKSMQQYIALVPASKVILGQPYYGRKACVASPDIAHQYPDTHQYQMTPPNFVSPTYLNAISTPWDTDVSSFKAHRDPSDGVSEWDTFWSSAFGCWREQYWDDATSLGAKYDVVNSMNLAGAGLFTLDYAADSPEAWNMIALKFTTTTPWFSLGGLISYGPHASSSGASRTDVFVRGTDNGVWQETWNGTTWNPSWASVGGAITSGAAAVSWAATRIDVFARGTDNGLWHIQWDGTRWSPWVSQGGVLTSGAGVASLAPGRLDVFVRGTDSALWHLWWTNTGGWSGWQSLGGVLTSDPAAVAWGPNHLDVFARGTNNGLWHIYWDGAGGWSSWQSLGGLMTSGPASASCSAGHLDVYATGTDAALYQLGYNGTAWNTSWVRLGGYWASDPGAVCPTGTTTVNLFERGPDAALWRTSVTGT
jgi:spore germination protein YaaH